MVNRIEGFAAALSKTFWAQPHIEVEPKSIAINIFFIAKAMFLKGVTYFTLSVCSVGIGKFGRALG